MDRRGFVRLVGGGAIASMLPIGLGGCGEIPAEALAAWRQPPGGGEPRLRLLQWAQLAPNPHNRQPWLVDLRRAPDEIWLYCDRSRLLPETDPYSRQILIGHGAFLELLVQAAAAEGFRADVTAFPDGAFGEAIDDRPVARIRLQPAAPQVSELFAALPHRRSTKTPFDPARPLDPAAMARLREALGVQTLRLEASSEPATTAELRKLAMAAWMIEANTTRTHMESVRLMRIGGEEIAQHRDGISLAGPMIWWGAKLGMISREAIATPGSGAFQAAIDRYAAIFAASPTFAWLVSGDNSRQQQLAAGRAYARLDLAAAAAGIAIHPISQVLQEYPEMAALQENFNRRLGIAAPERVQMLVRLGYAERPGPSPRRPLQQLLL